MGSVKTRLSPPLDPAQAALLYGAFLRDTLSSALRVREAAVYLFHPPAPGGAALEVPLPDGVTCVEERGAGLDNAMHGAFEQLFALGATAVVLIGADLPTLPRERIEDAFSALRSGRIDLVLGPAEDGGYYLIGLRASQPALFENVDWGSERVLAQTLDRARDAGLEATLIDPWHDVDTPDDLRRLARELEADPCLAAPATRQTLATIAGAGL